MSISSEEARNLQFSGTEHSYDGGEVEKFRQRVVNALASYETVSGGEPADIPTAAPVASPDDLAAAQRVRQQAVHLAERMLRDVMGASGDDAGGLNAWQEAAMLRAVAEEEMAFAREEARRLPAIAQAERDEMRDKYAEERTAVRRELQNELQASRSAAHAEADQIRATASAEAAEILSRAIDRSAARQQEAAEQMHRMERRLGVLQTALADAEGRFRRLAATAANELGTLSAIVDDDITSGERTQPDLRIAEVDLTEGTMQQVGAEQTGEEGTGEKEDADMVPDEGFVKMDPDAGFYQRRLAGLRDRLEKSGHPPGGG